MISQAVIIFVSGFLGGLIGSLISLVLLLRKLEGLMNPREDKVESFINDMMEGLSTEEEGL